MKIHKLKTLSTYFQDIKSKIKTFEVRKNDRNFEIGNMLLLMEWSEQADESDTIQSQPTSPTVVNNSQIESISELIDQPSNEIVKEATQFVDDLVGEKSEEITKENEEEFYNNLEKAKIEEILEPNSSLWGDGSWHDPLPPTTIPIGWVPSKERFKERQQRSESRAAAFNTRVGTELSQTRTVMNCAQASPEELHRASNINLVNIGKFTGEGRFVKINYILEGGQFGIELGYVVLGIEYLSSMDDLNYSVYIDLDEEILNKSIFETWRIGLKKIVKQQLRSY